MNIKLLLSNLSENGTGDFGFEWVQNDSVYFKGFFFDKENNLFTDQAACVYFSEIANISEFKKKVENLNGQFCIVVKKENEIWLASDIIRSLPLFYTFYKNEWIISDLTDSIIKFTGLKPQISNQLEFRILGYVTGKNTLLENIFQVQACEIVTLSDSNPGSIIYCDFFSQKTRIGSDDSFIEEIGKIIENEPQKLIKVLNNQTAIVPLSGGYDSRLIVYLLKKANYKNVVCYTYGTKDNYEVENARNTAEKLGYRWIFIDYSKFDLTAFLSDPEFIAYYKFLANHSSMFMMQEYFAVKYLKENGIINSNSVFLPGHSGDMLGGSHFIASLRNISKPSLANEILDKYYVLTEITQKQKFGIKQQLIKEMPDGYLPHSIFENILIKERQAKFICNSARVYDFFGFRYYMPLWDRDLVNFFINLPFKLRLYKVFYIKIVQQLFGEYGINYKNELQPSVFQYKKQSFKKYILNILPLLKHIKKLPENDIFRSGDITKLMIKEMKERGIHIVQTKQFNGIYTQWYLSKLENLTNENDK
jgi:asparagine synthase (glutamine-hydrolysing)